MGLFSTPPRRPFASAREGGIGYEEQVHLEETGGDRRPGHCGFQPPPAFSFTSTVSPNSSRSAGGPRILSGVQRQTRGGRREEDESILSRASVRVGGACLDRALDEAGRRENALLTNEHVAGVRQAEWDCSASHARPELNRTKTCRRSKSICAAPNTGASRGRRRRKSFAAGDAVERCGRHDRGTDSSRLSRDAGHPVSLSGVMARTGG